MSADIISHNDDDDDEGRINFSVALSPKTTRTRNNGSIQGAKKVFELPGGSWWLNPPQLFSQPPNTLSNYVLGGQLYTIYIRFRPTSHFWSVSNRRKVQPPANFSQFKHWAKISTKQSNYLLH